jgi:hypothetical protein
MFSYESFPDAADSETIDVRYGKTISHLVEHPIQLKPPDEPSQPHYLKVCFPIILLIIYL